MMKWYVRKLELKNSFYGGKNQENQMCCVSNITKVLFQNKSQQFLKFSRIYTSTHIHTIVQTCAAIKTEMTKQGR